MKKRYTFILFCLVFSSVFAQENQNETEETSEIELPDIVTVINNKTMLAGNDVLPDFKNIVDVKDGSGSIVPVLPDMSVPQNSDVASSGVQTEKTLFVEGKIGGGYPLYFTGDFSVYNLTEKSPFKIDFSHNSVAGFSRQSLNNGFDSKATSFSVEKEFNLEKADISGGADYNSFENGLQNKIQNLSSYCQDDITGFAGINYNFTENFSSGLKLNGSYYNRYSKINAGSDENAVASYLKQVSLLELNPLVFLNWNYKGFNLDFSGNYWGNFDLLKNVSFSSSGKEINTVSNRGKAYLALSYEYDFFKIFGNVACVAGDEVTSTVVVPFTVGTDLNFKTPLSGKNVVLKAEGGLKSESTEISKYEENYKYTAFSFRPEEVSDWYGKLNFNLPVKDAFALNGDVEYKQTAFNNGIWKACYNSESKIYSYVKANEQVLSSDLELSYHYKIINVSGGWKCNWMDVPVFEDKNLFFCTLDIESEKALWGAKLEGEVAVNKEFSVPVVNFEGFVRLSPSVRLVLDVDDLLQLITGNLRTYGGQFIQQGGSATALVKFNF